MAKRSESDRIKFSESRDEFPFEFMRETERRLGRIQTLRSADLGDARFAYVSTDIERLPANCARLGMSDPNRDAVVPSPIRYLRDHHTIESGLFALPWAEYDKRRVGG